ncbi:MAG: hydrogenase-4 component G [Desulfamplus sp.]|nr:hydrogenase-4 component G [Desulfamplus sp.]MBF0411649.1 hydrogenase-4 component G [Desulfamplus sp.]
METGNISNTMSANLSYEARKFSGSVRSSYGSNEGGSKVEKDTAFNVMMSSFKVQVSLNTYENLNTQSSDFSAASAKPSSKPDDLFGEDGYWGVNKTAGRISDFVMSGAGDDIEKLKAGREGIQRGLRDAEKVWGGKMPDIAYQTIEKSLEAIDEKIKKLGGNVVDITA